MRLMICLSGVKKKDREKILEAIKKSDDARVIYRANALNLHHKGWTAIEVADILEITGRTVFNIENNYEELGLDLHYWTTPDLELLLNSMIV